MAIFLSSLGLVAALAQVPTASPTPTAAPDSGSALRSRIAQDSGDGSSWYLLGLALLRSDFEAHSHHTPGDTTTAQAVLDTADLAFRRAATLLAGTRRGDSARVFHVFTWGRRALWAWETGGMEAAAGRWSTAPEDVRLPAVLEELGENLLRACPTGGVLLVRAGPDAQAATYLRMARHLRTDLTVVPYEVWRVDSILQTRVMRDLGAPPATHGEDPGTGLAGVAAKRRLCAEMGLEKPPDLPAAGGGRHGRMTWKAHALVWVSGAGQQADTVPPQDFVFAALRLALDANDPWAAPAVQVYRHAAELTPGLCPTLSGFGVKDAVGCR